MQRSQTIQGQIFSSVGQLPVVALFNFVTFVRFVVMKSLLELYISDEPLPENLRNAIHRSQTTVLSAIFAFSTVSPAIRWH
jgi:hypothetical protein